MLDQGDEKKTKCAVYYAMCIYDEYSMSIGFVTCIHNVDHFNFGLLCFVAISQSAANIGLAVHYAGQ